MAAVLALRRVAAGALPGLQTATVLALRRVVAGALPGLQNCHCACFTPGGGWRLTGLQNCRCACFTPGGGWSLTRPTKLPLCLLYAGWRLAPDPAYKIAVVPALRRVVAGALPGLQNCRCARFMRGAARPTNRPGQGNPRSTVGPRKRSAAGR